MAGAGGAAGGSSAPAGTACPTGFMCIDPLKAPGAIDGIEIKDASGGAIPFACNDGSMGSMTDCTKDVKSACPMLTNPMCGHVFLAGSDVATVCIQPCTP